MSLTTSEPAPSFPAPRLPEELVASTAFLLKRLGFAVKEQTMDAYEGTVDFYVADPSDPIIRAYQGTFPTLFKPLSKMPAGLQAHLRVPELA